MNVIAEILKMDLLYLRRFVMHISNLQTTITLTRECEKTSAVMQTGHQPKTARLGAVTQTNIYFFSSAYFVHLIMYPY